ncbi:MAG: PLP-dependent cysteine synthase family protein [Verrucomicrobiota bacterium]
MNASHRDTPRDWSRRALGIIEADFNRSSDTHLVPLPLPAFPDIHLYFKDESSHPSGSLKHRLARSLFLYALSNGWLSEGMTVVEASSGSTAVSEAYFARLLGLRFVAVIPRGTSEEKVARIRFHGGEVHWSEDPGQLVEESAALATRLGGHFMDQFTYAERATDWRGNNNIAETIFQQMRREPHPEPAFIVCGAGTGGTSATLGRYVRYRGHETRIVVADPERSVTFDHFVTGDPSIRSGESTRIEGIGRPRVERSFLRSVVDGMVRVPDVCSLAALDHLESALGRRVGGSTGTLFHGALPLIQRMAERGERGSVVVLLCDGGERYTRTYYSSEWRRSQGLDASGELERIRSFLIEGRSQQWPVQTAGWAA